MYKTKKYPFNIAENKEKILAMHHVINKKIKKLKHGGAERYPGELDILKGQFAQLHELLVLCNIDRQIIYLDGAHLSLAKQWSEEYDRLKR